MTTKKLLAAEDIPLFQGISEEDLSRFFAAASYEIDDYARGEKIEIDGRGANRICVVLKGLVGVMRENFWGNTVKLYDMKRPDVFAGVVCYEGRIVPNVWYLASTQAQILQIPYTSVLATDREAGGETNSETGHTICRNYLKILSDDYIRVFNKMDLYSIKSLRTRILTYLSQMSAIEQSRYVEIPFNRAELAEYLNVDRSALSRELSRLKKEGILDYEGNTFRLLRQPCAEQVKEDKAVHE